VGQAEKSQAGWGQLRAQHSVGDAGEEEGLSIEEEEERQRQKARDKGRAQFARLKKTQTGHDQVPQRPPPTHAP